MTVELTNSDKLLVIGGKILENSISELSTNSKPYYNEM
jgi:hypothetical protein